MIRLLLILLLCLRQAAAHEMQPAFLEITETSAEQYDILWKVPAPDDAPPLLKARFDPAAETLGEPAGGISGGTLLQRWQIRMAGGLAGTTIHIDGLSGSLADALVRVNLRDLDPQSILLKPLRPSFTVAEMPDRRQVAATYVRLGIEHILLGIDHLLFVLGLLLIVDRRWMLVKTITAFTAAHSITLALSTFAVFTVPEAPLNAAIALSILFLGPEIVRKWRGGTSLTLRHPWLVAFAFGLLHGIGFAGGLSLSGVPRPEIPLALLGFNLGVETGQLAFVLVALLAARAIRFLELDRPAWIARIPGYAVGTLGAFWTIDRFSAML